MTAGMLALTIAGVVAQHAGRREAAEGFVVAHVIPDPGDIGLVLGQQRDRRVVGVELVCRQNMRFKQQEQGPGYRSNGTNLVGQRRQAQRDAFRFKPVALTVERLMQAVLLEDEVGEEVRAEHSARRHMEGRRGLADLLALPARDFLADRADHLVTCRFLLERLGNVGGQTAKIIRSAARALLARRHDHVLAGQVRGEVPPGATLAGEGGNARGPGRGDFTFDLGGAGVGLQLLEGDLQLFEQAAAALGAGAIFVAAHLLIHQLKVRVAG